MNVICCDKHNFVTTKVLSRQAYFCHDRRVCHDKTHLLLWQNYVCHDKSFVMTKDVLSSKNRWWKTEKLIKKKNYFPIKQIAFKLKINFLKYTLASTSPEATSQLTTPTTVILSVIIMLIPGYKISLEGSFQSNPQRCGQTCQTANLHLVQDWIIVKK